ncbi:MAG TPA: nicotinamide mononucleotide transporter family protein, partial [Thermoanaerobaculia bacterium]|nr:nicotinamide mononucleotide transporter family protein [Thermoanaerobaculia bacterium]
MTFTPLETFAALFGAVSVYLSVRENVWSWPTAIVNVTLYILVFLRAKLYADMALQVVYIVISVYGWNQWLHGGAGRSTLPVTRITRRMAAALFGIGAVSVVVLATLLG